MKSKTIIKKIKSNTLVAVLSFVLLLGCSDALEVDPITTWSQDTFYSNSNEIDIALAGIYGSLRVIMSRDFSSMQAGTDESQMRAPNNENNYRTSLYSHTESNTNIVTMWRTLYSAINNANQFEFSIKQSNFDNIEDYNRFVGEARFLRGYCYLILTGMWDEVPLRITPVIDQSSNHVAPSPVEDVYLQIIDDLTFAADNLLLTSDPRYVSGRANSMAAHGLLSRTYLKAGGYPLQATEIGGINPFEAAKNHCEIIMNSGEHDLNPSYEEVFRNYIKGNFDYSESLFEIVFKDFSNVGSGGGGRIGDTNGLFINQGTADNGLPDCIPDIIPTCLAETKFELEDERLDWNLPNMYVANAAGRIQAGGSTLTNTLYSCGKFRRWEPSVPGDIDASNEQSAAFVITETSPISLRTSSINFPVLRFSDVLLMFAEASNQLNSGPTAEAINAINRVRLRAGLNDLATDNPTALAGKDNFFNEIVDERFRELFFEGNRRSDLIRWNLLEAKLKELGDYIPFHPDYSTTAASVRGALRPFVNFDPGKHLSFPYPLQEVDINNKLEQKLEW